VEIEYENDNVGMWKWVVKYFLILTLSFPHLILTSLHFHKSIPHYAGPQLYQPGLGRKQTEQNESFPQCAAFHIEIVN